jgi:hypothetical protein
VHLSLSLIISLKFSTSSFLQDEHNGLNQGRKWWNGWRAWLGWSARCTSSTTGNQIPKRDDATIVVRFTFTLTVKLFIFPTQINSHKMITQHPKNCLFFRAALSLSLSIWIPERLFPCSCLEHTPFSHLSISFCKRQFLIFSHIKVLLTHTNTKTCS